MEASSPPDDLIDYLTKISRLDRDEARRLLLEVLAYFCEPREAFVVRRHRELRAEGHPNREIFERIAAEVGGRRFPSPALSQRQIRRLVYG